MRIIVSRKLAKVAKTARKKVNTRATRKKELISNLVKVRKALTSTKNKAEIELKKAYELAKKIDFGIEHFSLNYSGSFCKSLEEFCSEIDSQIETLIEDSEELSNEAKEISRFET